MKRFAVAALAALTFTAPLATTAAYADPPRHERNDNDRGRDNDRNDRRDNDRNDRRGDRNDNRRWDQSRYNGYYANGRFQYGAPSAQIQRRADYRPAYQNWRRGDRLPSYYRSHYRAVDYRHAHLRAPPRGYQYVRDDRGNTLLVGIATGVILSVLLSQ